MATIEVSPSKFGGQSQHFLNLADAGSKVVLRRRGGRSYMLTPMEEEPREVKFSPEMEAKIALSLEQARRGEVTRVTSLDELHQFLNSL